MSLSAHDPQSRDVQLQSIRPHALFSFGPSLSLFQTAATDPGHGTKILTGAGSSVILPLQLVTAKMGGIPCVVPRRVWRRWMRGGYPIVRVLLVV